MTTMQPCDKHGQRKVKDCIARTAAPARAIAPLEQAQSIALHYGTFDI
jgi:hypothetical protein